MSLLSPLRYPGGKRRLATYVNDALRLNKVRPRLFVEPFAGGASVSLSLLASGSVDGIVLGERDPLVASFWKTAFFDTDWLVEAIRNVPITLSQWKRFRASPGQSVREQALACIFLNRTSFSGILAHSAGPIGGQKQTSCYSIGCRFNVEGIIRRIQDAAEFSPRVLSVHEGSWQETAAKVRRLGYRPDEVFFYLDPPFYDKADRLYRYYFRDQDHKLLHAWLTGLESRWLLSYDAADTMISLYSSNGRGPRWIELLYSVAASARLVQAKELLVTNLPKLPRKTRLWASDESLLSDSLSNRADERSEVSCG